MVRVQVQGVGGATLDHLSHGNGLPAEEVDAALGDGVFGLVRALCQYVHAISE